METIAATKWKGLHAWPREHQARHELEISQTNSMAGQPFKNDETVANRIKQKLKQTLRLDHSMDM